MTVTVDEMKNYLRIDYEDDDSLIENFITAGEEAVHGYPADGR